MKNLQQYIRIAKENDALSGWVCLLVSVALVVAGFILPPRGQIDPTVLIAVGELIFFDVVLNLPNMIASIKDGRSFRIKHNDTELEVSSKKED